MTSRQTDSLHYLTMTEAASRIRARQTSSLELTRHTLDRITALDPDLHAYATVMRDTALASAERADKEIASGTDRGPLHGIPVAVKDLCFTRGVPTMGGMAVYADHVPDYDATVVRRLADAGAILMGKLNLTEGAMVGYHRDFAIPANPWDRTVWAGASSSGSGVASAAGLAFATLGSDTGGSIRFPAAACGVVGLKPTWGRVSRHGVIPLAESLDHIGPLTRCTADAAMMFEAIAGYDANDTTSLRSPVAKISDHIADGIAGVRMGIDRKNIEDHCDPVVAQAVLENADIFAALGARLIDVQLPNIDAYVSAWSDICSAEAALAHQHTFPSQSDDYGPWFRGWLQRGNRLSAVDYARAHLMRLACVGEYRKLQENIDLLLIPSMALLPPVYDPQDLYGPMENFDLRMTSYTAVFDFTGAPTLSLPCGFSYSGLPLSLQLVARHEQELLLCQAGFAYEGVTDWHERHPPL